MKTTHNGRTYELTNTEEALPNLRAELLRNGWDGNVYRGFSKATGRQRKDFHGLFYRSVKTGEFVSVL
jgi:hypothetical protein